MNIRQVETGEHYVVRYEGELFIAIVEEIIRKAKYCESVVVVRPVDSLSAHSPDIHPAARFQLRSRDIAGPTTPIE